MPNRIRLIGRLPLALLAASVLAAPCAASLGGDEASVEADRARLQGSRKVTSLTGYAVHELAAPTGTVVREFVGADGAVFAVTWQGPFVPNLRQLLGRYFEPFSRAVSAQPRRPGRHALVVRGEDFVVESGGRMRAVFGRAYLRGRTPLAMDDGGIQ